MEEKIEKQDRTITIFINKNSYKFANLYCFTIDL